jgi:signal transduction histidine kinase
MTKTDASIEASGGISERLALVERQRRFEWELARDAQTRAAGQFVSGKTHDLLNLVQIVQLASLELSRRCSADAGEFITDLLKAAEDAKHQLQELMAVARPDVVIVPGAPVGAALTAAVVTVRAASTIPVDLHLTVHAEIATRCDATELAHIVYGLVLDAAADVDTHGGPIELFVRERTIDGKPWLEIVRGARAMLDGEHFDLRAVEAIAVKNGGELAHSERRGGGTEVVVALPLLASQT